MLTLSKLIYSPTTIDYISHIYGPLREGVTPRASSSDTNLLHNFFFLSIFHYSMKNIFIHEVLPQLHEKIITYYLNYTHK